MKKYLLICFFFAWTVGFCQQDAWVYFTAKPDSQFYFDNPLQMLSQRALDRRLAQNIDLDVLDIPIPQTYIDQIEAAPGITVKAKSKWLNAVHIRGTAAAINSLAALEIVASIDFADDSLDSRSTVTPVVPTVVRAAATQVVFPYGTSAYQIQMLNGQVLHQQDYTGAGKLIAVLDAGFPGVDTAQPFQRLWNNNLVLGGYNYVDRNNAIFTRNSHGTLVLSTMGGYVANQLVGTAPDAGYYLFITEDTDSENPIEESNWVEAAEAADSLGVDVISSSLGYFLYDNPAYSYSYSDMNGTTSFVSRGADIAFSRGMIVVASAGNTGDSANPHIGVPADAANVLTVGAVDASGNYAAFSSVGPTADGRIKPDVMAQGQGAVFAGPGGGVSSGNGTSFSAPILAGMVASFWQALPNKTNAEIVQLVKGSASLYPTPNNQYGFGIPDFGSALDGALSVPGFAFAPNPATHFLTFSLPAGTEQAHVVIYAMTGQKVASVTVTADSAMLPIESLGPGMYMYRITAGDRVETGKFIKK